MQGEPRRREIAGIHSTLYVLLDLFQVYMQADTYSLVSVQVLRKTQNDIKKNLNILLRSTGNEISYIYLITLNK